MTHLLRKNSQIPAYMAYPRFLLTMDISETAKLVYVLLLDRARLSMKNDGWEDEQGHVFIYYTIEALAEASGKSEMTVKNALAALERQGLNVEYMYASVFGVHNRAVLIFRFDDTDSAIEKLTGCADLKIVDSELFFSLK